MIADAPAIAPLVFCVCVCFPCLKTAVAYVQEFVGSYGTGRPFLHLAGQRTRRATNRASCFSFLVVRVHPLFDEDCRILPQTRWLLILLEDLPSPVSSSDEACNQSHLFFVVVGSCPLFASKALPGRGRPGSFREVPTPEEAAPRED